MTYKCKDCKQYLPAESFCVSTGQRMVEKAQAYLNAEI